MLTCADALPIFLQNICRLNRCTCNLVKHHEDVFKNELGTLKDYKVHIYVKDDVKPKVFRARPVPHALKKEIENELDRLVNESILEPVKISDWATTIDLFGNKSINFVTAHVYNCCLVIVTYYKLNCNCCLVIVTYYKLNCNCCLVIVTYYKLNCSCCLVIVTYYKLNCSCCLVIVTYYKLNCSCCLVIVTYYKLNCSCCLVIVTYYKLNCSCYLVIVTYYKLNCSCYLVIVTYYKLNCNYSYLL